MAGLPYIAFLDPARTTEKAFTVASINDDGGSVQLQISGIDVTKIIEVGDTVPCTFAATYTAASHTVTKTSFSTNSLITINLTYSASTTGTVYVADNDILRKYVDWSGSMDSGRLRTYLRAAQEIDLRGALGNDFYNDYVLANFLDQSSPDAELWPLLGYIYPCLSYWAYAYYLEAGETMQTRTGPKIFTGGDTRNERLSGTELQRQVTAARSTAIMYAARLDTFINDNIGSYTDYSPKTNRQQSGRGFVAL